jgi:hypothetical protein
MVFLKVTGIKWEVEGMPYLYTSGSGLGDSEARGVKAVASMADPAPLGTIYTMPDCPLSDTTLFFASHKLITFLMKKSPETNTLFILLLATIT